MRKAISRRALLAGLATAPFIRPATAQAAYSMRPVPYPPAGGADTTAQAILMDG